MRIPSIKCLQTFEALARLRSVTQTANELCVTPSAISVRIKQIETIAGISLFVRDDFSLTPDGVEYLSDIQSALGVLERRFSNFYAK